MALCCSQEIERLKENLVEAHKLVLTSTNTTMEILEQSLGATDHNVTRKRLVAPLLTAVVSLHELVQVSFNSLRCILLQSFGSSMTFTDHSN